MRGQKLHRKKQHHAADICEWRFACLNTWSECISVYVCACVCVTELYKCRARTFSNTTKRRRRRHLSLKLLVAIHACGKNVIFPQYMTWTLGKRHTATIKPFEFSDRRHNYQSFHSNHAILWIEQIHPHFRMKIKVRKKNARITILSFYEQRERHDNTMLFSFPLLEIFKMYWPQQKVE